MKPDIVDLRDFYASARGRLAARLIARGLEEIWSDPAREDVVIGFGYAVPYIAALSRKAQLSALLMPAAQGVMPWPQHGLRRTILVEEGQWPIPDNSVNRLILTHAVERAGDLQALLREAWRVLCPNGRLIIVAPNRHGLWARTESTPFGHGLPFSERQLRAVLREHLFVPEMTRRALYVPPLKWRFALGPARWWDRIAEVCLPFWAGVIIMEASKQLYGAVTEKGEIRSVTEWVEGRIGLAASGRLQTRRESSIPRSQNRRQAVAPRMRLLDLSREGE